MVKKNWQAISTVTNEQLRLNLIAASGEVAEGLARGFPQYFLTEGQEHPRMMREVFLTMVKTMGRRDNVVQACKDAGIPYQRFSFRGSCKGSVGGVSSSNGGYDTVANGWAEYFWRSNKCQGDSLDFEGATWIVVWNGFSSGDEYSFDSHSFIIVPIEVFEN